MGERFSPEVGEERGVGVGETRLGVHLGPQEYEGPAGPQVKVE